MANNENLKPVRSKSEARERGRNGGKASGQSRRRKADFRKVLNALLTAEIDSSEWTPMLEALGLDSTLESAVNAAMIKAALAGNVKAYEAIAKYSGQTDRTAADLAEQDLRMEQSKAQTDKLKKEVNGNCENDDGVEVVNDAPKETGKDFRACDTEIPANL